VIAFPISLLTEQAIRNLYANTAASFGVLLIPTRPAQNGSGTEASWETVSSARIMALFVPALHRSWNGVAIQMPLPEADPRRIGINPSNPNRICFAGNMPDRMGLVTERR